MPDDEKPVQAPKKRETLEEELARLDLAIDAELEEWSRNHMSPDQINIDVWRLDIKVNVLIALVLEKMDVTADEMNLRYRRAILANLQSFREQYAPLVKKAMAESRIAVPEKQGIVLPFNKDKL